MEIVIVACLSFTLGALASPGVLFAYLLWGSYSVDEIGNSAAEDKPEGQAPNSGVSQQAERLRQVRLRNQDGTPTADEIRSWVEGTK